MDRQTNDGTGNTVVAGDTVQGFGLSNAGRYATIVEIGRTAGRALIEHHLTGKRQWVFLRYYRKHDA